MNGWFFLVKNFMGTPPKTNIKPEKFPFGKKKEKHLLKHQFLGFHVSFRGCNISVPWIRPGAARQRYHALSHNKSDVWHAGDVAHEMALVVGGSQFFASWKKHGKKGSWLFMLNATRVNIGILINHDVRIPINVSSIMECRRVFFRGSVDLVWHFRGGWDFFDIGQSFSGLNDGFMWIWYIYCTYYFVYHKNQPVIWVNIHESYGAMGDRPRFQKFLVVFHVCLHIPVPWHWILRGSGYLVTGYM